MEEYYRRRAPEFEEIYGRSDHIHRHENKILADSIKSALNGRENIEIACGTGYWTRFLAKTAASIIATDLIPEMLEIAKEKEYDCPTNFRLENAYDLSFREGSFTGGLSTFWISHIPKARLHSFLTEFHRVMRPGSVIFIADNVYDPEVDPELLWSPSESDTYVRRYLKDKSKYKIIKNYYSFGDLYAIFHRYSATFSQANIKYGKRVWFVSYEL